MPLAEVILWKRLRGKQLNGVKFRRQYSIGNFIVDFYSTQYKLVIELDGDSHFQGDNLDKLKESFLQKNSIKLLRFTNTEVYNNLESVTNIIMQNTSPDPSLVMREKSHNYINFKTETIADFSDENIEKMYSKGFVMTRLGKGVMNQTTSLRINLSEFELTSENRRILRKNEDITTQVTTIPLTEEYNWKIHKTGKDFYSTKFGDNTFSASKIKELVTTEHNFNALFKYFQVNLAEPVGYCIVIRTSKILHYCYPFYDLAFAENHPNLGMGMMLKAIIHAKEDGLEYVYLGSLTRPEDKYKLQFMGLEKWNNETQIWEKIEV